MSTIAILVPVWKRPHRAEPLVESILAHTTVDVEIVFVVTARDADETRACRGTGQTVLVLPGEHAPGDYARKINYAIGRTSAPFVFQAADDLRFTDGWDEHVLAVMGRSETGVVGTDDIGNARTRKARHSTHSLIRRAYVDEHGTIDEVGKALHEGYRHNFCDDELLATARYRNAYRPSLAIVEHLHPNWRKSERDVVYDHGEAGFDIDRALFRARRPLWDATLARQLARRSRP